MAKAFLSRRLMIASLVSVLALFAGYLAWAGQRALIVSHEAVCGKVLTTWVGDYVDAHDGQWPKQWEDLLETPCRGPGSFAADPASALQTLKTRCEMDFNVDPKQLAQQSAAEFTAIRPRVNRGVDHRDYWGVNELLETLRKYHAQK
jgi:hypothetical protein